MKRLHSTYVSLTIAPKIESNGCMVSVARFGAFEVRLVEPANHPNTDGPDFWIELYRHYAKSSLDSYRCRDLEEGELTAHRLISDAKELHETSDESSLT